MCQVQMSGIIRLEVPRAWYSPVVKNSLDGVSLCIAECFRYFCKGMWIIVGDGFLPSPISLLRDEADSKILGEFYLTQFVPLSQM